MLRLDNKLVLNLITYNFYHFYWISIDIPSCKHIMKKIKVGLLFLFYYSANIVPKYQLYKLHLGLWGLHLRSPFVLEQLLLAKALFQKILFWYYFCLVQMLREMPSQSDLHLLLFLHIHMQKVRRLLFCIYLQVLKKYIY